MPYTLPRGREDREYRNAQLNAAYAATRRLPAAAPDESPAPARDVVAGLQDLARLLDEGKLTAADRNERALIPVKISSDPGGADVLLDGSFVTSTPGVLRLQPGTYKIVVKKTGYADWERDLTVLPGAEITVNAALSR